MGCSWARVCQGTQSNPNPPLSGSRGNIQLGQSEQEGGQLAGTPAPPSFCEPCPDRAPSSQQHQPLSKPSNFPL